MNNTVILVGRLTKNIEVRYTQNEKAIGNFTLAVQRQNKNDKGEYEADFINCVAFEQGAKYLEKYSTKGDVLGIKGRIQSRNYEDKEGKKHYITEVVVEKVTILSSKKKETNEFENASIKTEQQQQFEIDDNMLPF